MRRLLTLLALTFAALTAQAATHPDWTTPLPPFQIADNLYYVGSRDLASYLITTPAGDILINSALPSSPPLIRHSIEQLGFHFSDIKILLISHAHFDHAGGSAAILKQTHAKYEVMDADVSSIRTGGRTGFAFATDGILPFPPAHVDRILHDGDTVTLGNTTLTAHKTPGHTPGCTTWTLRVHVPGEPDTQLRNVVIVGGFSALSQYSLTGRATPSHPATYPAIATDFQHTFATLRSLPCDIFLGAHGVYFNMLQKLPSAATKGPSIWIDPQGYQAAIYEAEQDFNTNLAKQQAAAAARPTT